MCEICDAAASGQEGGVLEPADPPPPSRRQALRQLGTAMGVAASGLALSSCLGGRRLLPGFGQSDGERFLTLDNVNTKERMTVRYWLNGAFDLQGLEAFSYMLRDHHANVMTPIDPSLADLVWHMQQAVGHHGPVEVLSGYRSPETNRALRRRNRRAARNSMHMHGKAVDLRLPGVPVPDLKQVAIGMRAGGVGHYRRASYLHLDVGPVRTWS